MRTNIKAGTVPQRVWLLIAEGGETRMYTTSTSLGQALANGYWDRATVREFHLAPADINALGAQVAREVGAEPPYPIQLKRARATGGRLRTPVAKYREINLAHNKAIATWRKNVKQALVQLLG